MKMLNDAAKSSAHPLWAIIRLSLLMATLVLVLWLTASRFDNTELQTILVMFLAASGMEGASILFRGKQGS